MKIIRVNTRTRDYTYESVPSHWQQLGGRGLIAQILLDEVPPECDPLGPKNKLIFASGLLTGYRIPSCDRISLGGKSPLTGGVKESNAGGRTGMHLAGLGIKALILEDAPGHDDFSILHVTADGVDFEEAGTLVHQGTYETTRRLLERYGKKCAIALIGPVGERKWVAACVNHVDFDGHSSRVSGRGGMGAVMGSKGIKAVVVDEPAQGIPSVCDPDLFRETRKIFAQTLVASPQVEVWRDYGTAANVAMTNMLGCLPTRGFSRGRFDRADNIGGDALRELLLKRPKPSTPTHACMVSCVIRCSNILAGETGEEIVAPLEYETIGMMGSNLEFDDLDFIGRLNWYANDLGMDSIELGATLGLAMDAGWAGWGDQAQVVDLIQEIYQNTSRGKIIASGVSIAGKALGAKQIPAVKGQAMAAYDPRALKGTGVTYATSPQGADHTAGFTLRAKVDHLDPDANVKVSRGAQINTAAVDSLGVCSMASLGFAAPGKSILRDFLRSIYGWQVGEDIQQVIGKNVIRMELEYNRRAGFTSKDDRLPAWITSAPLPPTNSVFDVSEAALDHMFDEEK